jgi:hypothetical protein
MICDECWASIEDEMVGKTNEAEQKVCTSLSELIFIQFM